MIKFTKKKIKEDEGGTGFFNYLEVLIFFSYEFNFFWIPFDLNGWMVIDNLGNIQNPS